MAIDGQIERVRNVPEGIELELCPRYGVGSGEESIPGQNHLTILNPTWTPAVGMEIWGSASSVEIVTDETGVRREYERVGYTRLKEKFLTAEPQEGDADLKEVAEGVKGTPLEKHFDYYRKHYHKGKEA